MTDAATAGAPPLPRVWQDRIIGSGEMPPDQFLANPFNFRIHSAAQEEALEEVLDRVGWVRRVLVNRRTGHVLDGHLRVALGIRRGESVIPYDEVDLDEADEKLVLVALDPIAAMAGTDGEILKALLADVSLHEDGSLKAMLASLEQTAGDGHAAPQAQDPATPHGSGALADRFIIPPFSVLNAREGWWQDRKRAWLAIGIKSELGRGQCLTVTTARLDGYRDGLGMQPLTHTPGPARSYTCGGPGELSSLMRRRQQNHAAPAGSALPAADYSKRQRGAGNGRALPGSAAAKPPKTRRRRAAQETTDVPTE